jgi:hypothetical protein
MFPKDGKPAAVLRLSSGLRRCRLSGTFLTGHPRVTIRQEKKKEIQYT